MAQIEIHLTPQNDGSVAVSAQFAERRSEPHDAPLLRILFTACAPSDLPGLDYEKEDEAILRIADNPGNRVDLEIAGVGTFDELREVIVWHRPHIVRPSGHGSVRDGIGSFPLENESGQLDLRDTQQAA